MNNLDRHDYIAMSIVLALFVGLPILFASFNVDGVIQSVILGVISFISILPGLTIMTKTIIKIWKYY